MNIYANRALVLAPHTDDAEIGMGGTIHRLVREQGCEIRIVAFSSCDESLPSGFPEGTLRAEAVAAAAVLGVPEGSVKVLSYPVRRFGDCRQEILEELVSLKSNYDPDLVFAPSSSDVHQDHHVIHAESVRAFKDRTLLGYEMSWNCINFNSAFMVNLSAEDVEAKATAIKKYKSQAFRSYGGGGVLQSLAAVRGSSIRSSFAEAFEPMRVVWS